MGVKGYMRRGNQVGLEKTCIPVHLRCSCMAAAGPAKNTKFLNLSSLLMGFLFCCLAGNAM